MGCGSCGNNNGSHSPGCGNNGACSTGSCNKLNVYNWLTDMVLPEDYEPFNIVEVRFKGSKKQFYKNVNHLELFTGDKQIEFNGDYETDGFIYIQQQQPLPMTITAMYPQLNTYDG